MDMDNLNQVMAAGAAAANAAAAANPAVAATMNLMGAAAVAFPPAGAVVAATSSAAPPGVGPSVANHAQPQEGCSNCSFKSPSAILSSKGPRGKQDYISTGLHIPSIILDFR